MNEANLLKPPKSRMPHTFVIIFLFMLLGAILTWVVPAGTFDRAFDEATGRTLVVPGTFQEVEQTPVGPASLIMSIYDGMVNAAGIVFFTFFSYGFMVLMVKVGAFDSAVGALIRRLKGKERFVLPALAIVFSLMGAGFGIYEEIYGFVPIVMGMAVALGYDPLYGAIVVLGGMATGYAAASINPYTVIIAQTIAELPIISGMWFRWICYAVFLLGFLWFSGRYAKRVKADPSKSYVYGIDFPMISHTSHDELVKLEFKPVHRLSIILFVLTVIGFAFGAIKYHWYFSELSAIFVVMMFVIGKINKMTVNEICTAFVDINKNILFAAFVIGLSRGILIVMQNGQIIDPICNFFANSLTDMPKIVAAEAMFLFQTLLNLFIPSGSGQAVTSMPIMVPLADLLGLNRQIAVLAFQFGDGFSNMFWPTACATLCAISGVPMNKWWKFFAPFVGICTLLAMIMIAVAVAINYGPY